jgi:osmotically inducible protein OsmC
MATSTGRVIYTARAHVTGGRANGHGRTDDGVRERLEVADVAIDSRVSLLPTEERTFRIGVELDVSLPSVQDADQAVALVQAAHRVCPYSNATRGNIDITLTANGAPVAIE